MYLTASRPDIMFTTCLYVRYQVNPNTVHPTATKLILCYLLHVLNLGIWFFNDQTFDRVAYSDSGYAGCKINNKSTSRGCQFLSERLVTWQCKKQIAVVLSTCEAEYIAAASCCS
ncbi:uncharacterized mitochondrial protein AtMg00810-like [Rutidosis leptorrhynchoides]|uniref:uncharacterized mitochondrial protein AtMg00810-like n=1 Tax=Rutidosis leptorrhynchoides TaxID=125765 RepID=UPI003A9902DD